MFPSSLTLLSFFILILLSFQVPHTLASTTGSNLHNYYNTPSTTQHTLKKSLTYLEAYNTHPKAQEHSEVNPTSLPKMVGTTKNKVYNPRHRREELEQRQKVKTFHAQADLRNKWGWVLPVGHYRNLAGSHLKVVPGGDNKHQEHELPQAEQELPYGECWWPMECELQIGKNWSSVGNYEYLRVERVRLPGFDDSLPLPTEHVDPLPTDNFVPLQTVAAPQQDTPDFTNTGAGSPAAMCPTTRSDGSGTLLISLN